MKADKPTLFPMQNHLSFRSPHSVRSIFNNNVVWTVSHGSLKHRTETVSVMKAEGMYHKVIFHISNRVAFFIFHTDRAIFVLKMTKTISKAAIKKSTIHLNGLSPESTALFFTGGVFYQGGHPHQTCILIHQAETDMLH